MAALLHRAPGQRGDLGREGTHHPGGPQRLTGLKDGLGAMGVGQSVCLMLNR